MHPFSWLLGTSALAHCWPLSISLTLAKSRRPTGPSGHSPFPQVLFGLLMKLWSLGTGVGSMSRYEQVLHHVRYRNWQPAALEARRFRIKCSELNGRYTSNEFNLEVSEP